MLCAYVPYLSLIPTLCAFASVRIRVLRVNDMHLTRLRTYASLPLSIGALRAFVLTCCVVTVEL